VDSFFLGGRKHLLFIPQPQSIESISRIRLQRINSQQLGEEAHPNEYDDKGAHSADQHGRHDPEQGSRYSGFKLSELV
jgi:hypothetical protein